MSDLEKELEKELDKAHELDWNDFCKTCHQYTMYCQDCCFEKGWKEPEMYLSARDMLLECEIESRND